MRRAGLVSQSERTKFSRQSRLARPQEFAAALRHGIRWSGRHCAVWVVRGPGPGARIGLVVGRKAAHRAVDRNRVRRAIREIFRLSQGALPTVDIVVRVRTGSEQALGALRAELATALASIESWSGFSSFSCAPTNI